MRESDYDSFIRAGQITRQVVAFAKTHALAGKPLRVFAEEIEGKIRELGGKPAFPVNLSMNEVAAHATPTYDDVELARGLLKVDIGVHVNGAIADTAFSVDLDGNPEYTKLIKAAEAGLAAAHEVIKYNVPLNKIGHAVENKISSLGYQVVKNLSGHGIEIYDVHAGISVPNYDNNDKTGLPEGAFAVEPFATNGGGKVVDGKPSGIYQLVREGSVRDSFARTVLEFIINEYQTLPFCTRWIHSRFGSRGLLALRFIEKAGVLHQYAQLVESSKGVVAQAEHTFLISKDKVLQIT